MDKDNFLIFIVDDDIFMIQLIVQHLEKNPNYSVTSFDNGEDCIKELGMNPDVVILDHFMDSGGMEDCMNGAEVLTKIKEQKKELPVIIHSGQDSSGVTFEFVSGDAHEYIQKSENSLNEIENCINKLFAYA
ncbi:MAG: response regulator [Bacteroidetes bacterium]|nr:MAG: response regulator [Bacteroidota bacterium]